MTKIKITRLNWRAIGAEILESARDPRVTLATVALFAVAALGAHCGGGHDEPRAEFPAVRIVCHEEPTGGAR